MNYCRDIVSRSLVEKKKYPRAFPIPYSTRSLNFAKSLCDLGYSINLMPLAVYKLFGLGSPKLTLMRYLMVDYTMKKPVGI